MANLKNIRQTHIGTGRMKPHGYLSPGHYSFLGSKIKKESAELSAVRKKYPYPPKNCEEAMQSMTNLESDIQTINEIIAAGKAKNETKRELAAHQEVLGQFRVYINNAQCVRAAISAEDEAFSKQIQDALDKETAAAGGKKNTDNIIIFSALGLILVGAVVIILKKQSA